MKTVERENRNRWAAAMLSIRTDGTAGQNRPCSSTWGWKQEKLQRWEKYFLLTSPSIERSKEPLWQREQHGVGRGHGPAEIGAYAGHGEIVGGCALAIDAELALVVEDCGALTANSA